MSNKRKGWKKRNRRNFEIYWLPWFLSCICMYLYIHWIIPFSPCIVIREKKNLSLCFISLALYISTYATTKCQLQRCNRKMICSCIWNENVIKQQWCSDDERWKRIFVLIYSTIHNDYEHNANKMYGILFLCLLFGLFVYPNYFCKCVFFFSFIFSISRQKIKSHGQEMKRHERGRERARTFVWSIKREWLNVCCLRLSLSVTWRKEI